MPTYSPITDTALPVGDSAKYFFSSAIFNTLEGTYPKVGITYPAVYTPINGILSFYSSSVIASPTVIFTPANGAACNTSVVVTATITDPDGVASATVYVDNVLKGNLAHISGDTYSLDIGVLTAGTRKITVCATDTLGNLESISHTITIEDSVLPDLNILTTSTDTAFSVSAGTSYPLVKYVDLNVQGAVNGAVWTLE